MAIVDLRSAISVHVTRLRRRPLIVAIETQQQNMEERNRNIIKTILDEINIQMLDYRNCNIIRNNIV